MTGETYFINTILQNPLLILQAQPLLLHHLILQHKDKQRVLRMASATDPIAARIELAPHRLCVFSQLHQHLRVVLQQGDGFARRGGQHGREGSREGVGGGRDALVLDDLFGAGAEATAGGKGAGHGADDHVDRHGVDVLVLGDAAAGAA